MKLFKVLLMSFLTFLVLAQNVMAADVDIKNFIVQPSVMTETFDEGNIVSDFLTISSAAVTSRIETEEDNSYLVFEDSVDDDTSALLTVSPPGNCAYERFIFSFDIYVPTMYAGSVNPSTNKPVNAISINFNAVDEELDSSARPVYYNITKEANSNSWIYYIVDSGQEWLGSGIEFEKWYNVRYEVNLRTHRYNIYLYERDSGALKGKHLNRMFRDKSTSGESFPIDNYYISTVTVQLDAKNNGEPISLYLDNIEFVKEDFYLFSEPEITYTDDEISVSATVMNESPGKIQSPILVFGIYDKDNTLVDVSYNCTTAVPPGKGGKLTPTKLQCTLLKPTLGTDYTIRAFVLTSLLNGRVLGEIINAEMQ